LPLLLLHPLSAAAAAAAALTRYHPRAVASIPLVFPIRSPGRPALGDATWERLLQRLERVGRPAPKTLSNFAETGNSR